jgi:hypothetical protein
MKLKKNLICVFLFLIFSVYLVSPGSWFSTPIHSCLLNQDERPTIYALGNSVLNMEDEKLIRLLHIMPENNIYDITTLECKCTCNLNMDCFCNQAIETILNILFINPDNPTQLRRDDPNRLAIELKAHWFPRHIVEIYLWSQERSHTVEKTIEVLMHSTTLELFDFDFDNISGSLRLKTLN